MEYLFLKWIHIISSTILFGTGVGSAFYMFVANRNKKIDGIYFATKHVVVADWLFTTPAIIVQLLTGVLLVNVQGHNYRDEWLLYAISLFVFSGICWIIVVFLQLKMRDMAKYSYENNTELPKKYWQYEKWWVMLGAVTFPAVMVIFYLMVFRP